MHGLEGSKALGIDLRDSSNVDSWWRLKQLVIVDAGASYELSLAAGATAAWEELVETTLKVRDRRHRRPFFEAKVAASSGDRARLSYALEVPSDTFLIEVVIEARSKDSPASAAGASSWLDSVVLEKTGPREKP